MLRLNKEFQQDRSFPGDHAPQHQSKQSQSMTQTINFRKDKEKLGSRAHKNPPLTSAKHPLSKVVVVVFAMYQYQPKIVINS